MGGVAVRSNKCLNCVGCVQVRHGYIRLVWQWWQVCSARQVAETDLFEKETGSPSGLISHNKYNIYTLSKR